MSATTLHVHSEHTYPVIVGPGVAANIGSGEVAQALAGATRAAVLCQPSVRGVAEDVAAAFVGDAVVHVVPDAEDGKTLQSLHECWCVLGDAGLRRSDVVIGVGGGAATDLAGFAAATWMRGVSAVHVSTTVAGMVDAAVGGKTGINAAHGKNLIGAFASPRAVLADTATLRTLPVEHIRAGLAEIIKCGMIADTTILDVVEADPVAATTHDSPVLHDLIVRGIAVKAAVVGQDFRESHAREALNFGHTLGHAIERVENYTWRHGDGVAVGMVFAAALAVETAESAAARTRAEGLLERLVRVLESVGLPTAYDGAAAYEDLRAAMAADKKARAGGLRFVTVPELGTTARLANPDEDALRRAYWQVCAE